MIRRLSTLTKKSRLSSFLQQADKDVTSTVYRGTLFELQTLECLETIAGMSLQHVGGKGDGGIDLRGHWFNNIQVIIQCKNLKTGCTPDHLRQLIGSTVISSSKKKTIGILSTISHRHFTRDVLSHFNSSPIPLGLATVQDTSLKSLMFNKKAQSMLKGLTVTSQFDSEGNESIYIDIPSSLK
ncbi:uncharacterized protein EV154DRAFT_495188 [Mucor mucedo]|uniref:uncharacterized protein n=1 Tax=Mucor mucedo TaxID=29922 RepID=UPI0022200E7E|nr:uncharacterized protein EV154DRAFT_495188 [Mucor mucedo]KAI7895536.1 hypothetical protein EV154DRAFT_495188 [Mucor mucedo]